VKQALTLLFLLFLAGCTRGAGRDTSHECDHIPYLRKAYFTPCPERYEYDEKYFYQGDFTVTSRTRTWAPAARLEIAPSFIHHDYEPVVTRENWVIIAAFASR
jgi:hypothetical protein